MKLLYIWVRKYKAFNDSEFNFDPEHHFHFDSRTSTLSYDYSNMIADFFNEQTQNDKVDKGRISNLTAIIGNNGAGKSTLLEIITNNLVYGDGGIKIFSLYIFEEQCSNRDKSIFKIYYYNINKTEGEDQSNLQIYLDKNTKEKELFIFEDKSKMVLHNNLNIEKYSDLSSISVDDLKETLFIYYSNVFEKTNYHYERMGSIEDISTTGLIQKDKKNLIEMKVRPLEFDCNLIFFHQDFLRQIDFICNYKNDSEVIRMPNYIDLGFVDVSFVLKKMYEQLYSNSKKDSPLNRLVNNIKILFNIFDENFTKYEDKNERIEFYFYKSLLVGYFYEMLPHVVPVNNIQIIILAELLAQIIKNGAINKKNPYIFTIIVLKSISKSIKGKQFLFAEKTRSFIYALRFYRVWIRQNKFRSVNFDNWNTRFTLSTMTKDTSFSIKRFFNVYKKTASLFDYLEFTLPMSSGENQMLNMFSRFYSLLDNSNKVKKKHLKINNDNINKVRNVIVLLDEADAMFHPEWQRTYIRLLMRFLTDIYRPYDLNDGSILDIQLIITSHSPIILSDIPKRNIIFLNHHDGNCIVDLNDHKETFGSNIHTLFLDSFFLNNGATIGDFAMSKIKWIISELDETCNKDIVFQNRIFQTIMLIGEPIIRNKLLKMYADKYNPEFIDIQNENVRLKEKIARFENSTNIGETLDMLKSQIEQLYEKIRLLESGKND